MIWILPLSLAVYPTTPHSHSLLYKGIKTSRYLVLPQAHHTVFRTSSYSAQKVSFFLIPLPYIHHILYTLFHLIITTILRIRYYYNFHLQPGKLRKLSNLLKITQLVTQQARCSSKAYVLNFHAFQVLLFPLQSDYVRYYIYFQVFQRFKMSDKRRRIIFF